MTHGQWYAIVYRTGPQAGEVRSYGTVITGDLGVLDAEGNQSVFDDVTYEKIPIDHQPNGDEMWDKAAKAVVAKPSPTDTPAQTLLKKPTWTATDNENALREILKKLS